MSAVRTCAVIAAQAFCLVEAGAALAHCKFNCIWTSELSGFFVLGDDLSDAGQYGARLTTNPGLTAPMLLAQQYGLSIVPSLTGGTDYAQGGARVTQSSPFIPPGQPQRSISTQLGELLKSGPLDPKALYLVQGGTNDLLFVNNAVAMGQLTAAQAQAQVVQTGNDLVLQVLLLYNAGARHIVIFTMPDLGKTPFAAAAGAQAALGGLSALFNSTLDKGLARFSVAFIPVNTAALLDEVVANPSIYGFKNATTPACTSVSSLNCTPATLREPDAAATYVFADSVNFTSQMHRVTAQYAASIIAAPEQIVLLGETPLQVAVGQFRSYDGRVRMAELGRAAKVETFGTVDFGNATIDASIGTRGMNSETTSLNVGADVAISENTVAGVLFGYSGNRSDFGSSGGGFKLEDTTLMGYLFTHGDAWYVGTQLMGSLALDFKNVHRNVVLGDATRTETGQTSGTYYGWRINGGWNFVAGDWTHGPIASIGYQKISIRGYAEQGSASTTMFFGPQDREASILSAGWQVAGRLNIAGKPVMPWAQVEGVFDQHRPHDRTVDAGLVTMDWRFTGSAYQPDTSHMKLDAGVAAAFSQTVSGFINANAIVGSSSGRYYGVSVGLKVAL